MTTASVQRPGVLMRWLALALALAVAPMVFAEPPQLEAQLDRAQIRADETARLVLSYRGDPGQLEPDTTALEVDFEILSVVAVRREDADAQTPIVRWRIDLAPRRSGDITVPAVQLGSLESLPQRLLVLPGGGGEATGPPLRVEMTATPQSPYVQQMVRLSVRVFRDQPQPGALSVTLPSDTLHLRLGPDLHYERIRNGHRYRVTERRYAVFPQASGRLDIESARFESADAQGARVEVRSAPVRVEVRRQPALPDGDAWLPATGVTLSGSASATDSRSREYRVRIEARDAHAAQIAPLPLPPSALGEIQRLPPTLETREHGEGTVAIREERFVLLPATSDFRLPTLRLPWWDTGLDLARDATLSAREMGHGPGGTGEVMAPSSARPAGSVDNETHVPPSGETVAGAVHGWQKPLVIVLVVLVAALAIRIWRKRRTRSSDRGARALWALAERCSGLPVLGRLCAWLALRHALAADGLGADARAADAALRRAFAVLLPASPPRSLPELAQRVEDEAFAHALHALDRSRFGADGDGRWPGELASLAWRAMGRVQQHHGADRRAARDGTGG